MGVRRRVLAGAGALLLALVGASLFLGPRFYGQGYALAALLACAWAYLRLEQTLHDLEFITFAPQPMALPEAPVAHVRGARS